MEAVKFQRAIMAACNAIIKVLQSRDFRQPCSIMYQSCPDCRRGHQGRLLLPVGSLSGLSHDPDRRPAHARSSPRRCGDQPRPHTVVPILPPERALRGIGVPIEVERCRGVLRGAQRQ